MKFVFYSFSLIVADPQAIPNHVLVLVIRQGLSANAGYDLSANGRKYIRWIGFS